MRFILLAGAAYAALSPALAFAAPIVGHPNASPAANGGPTLADPNSSTRAHSVAPAPAPGESSLDTLVAPDAPEEAPAPVATGDPVLDRLNAMEARIRQLETRNAQLEAAADESRTRIETVEVRAAKAVQFGWGPTFAEPTGAFTFKPRGVLDLDYAHFNERAGGYDYNDGTLIRRGRFGFDGTAFRNFAYRIEAEYVGNTVNLLDAYVAYTGFKNVAITIGQQKAPYGLEANTSDSFNTFLERGMANVAFGGIGAERRVGITAAYVREELTATVGVFGAGEAVGRNQVTPDEVLGFNGRVTWDPVLDVGRVVHVGASGYHVSNIAGNTVTVADRPDVREDDGRIVSATIAGTAVAGVAQTGARAATYFGGEGALVHGRFSVQGEYGKLSIDRYGLASTVDFEGGYGFASFFITGETRPFKNGVVDRLKPFNDFNPAAGHFGAFEVAARYDRLDLTDHGLSPLTRRATSLTGALNWYLNGNVRVQFNYIRFKGLNSPLVVAPVAVNGTTAKGDAFATRLHMDF